MALCAKVSHSAGRFFLATGSAGEAAQLLYELRPDGSLDLHHTQVPESLRGRGLGGVLAEVSVTIILCLLQLEYYCTALFSPLLITLKGAMELKCAPFCSS